MNMVMLEVMTGLVLGVMLSSLDILASRIRFKTSKLVGVLVWSTVPTLIILAWTVSWATAVVAMVEGAAISWLVFSKFNWLNMGVSKPAEF
jgi:hypothetical protein